ncbi:4-hydroxybutyrate CoA-transferase [Fusibacter paucivorans]|uniref:4-hydroxybutyrate CoA-transferase n=1 Tax=Fusibacter paucivorans TaxID=76009 RepID=A0ABS5PU12_9FIRM|nr:acetyl-CoA hydrolase/transferase C-terminal domain-containing protein [Fusibacter paucivorans]MBS7528659.1 4-hydroxybutyrate CoA-transferase [Fusibacter paucivorans]
MNWKEIYQSKLVSVERAAAAVESGDNIWISAMSDTPMHILDALSKRYLELEDVHLHSGILMRPFDFLKGEYKGHINYHSIFLGPVDRMFVPQGNVSATSMHFSNLSWALKNNIKPNVFMVTCTPPDENGYMNFGPVGSLGNDTVLQNAEKVIIQVNKNMPYIYGERNYMHVSQADFICEADYDMPVLQNPEVDDVDRKIASHIAANINDGDTLQIGIGSLGNAVAYSLEGKKDLGVHSEMLVDSLVYLAKKGVINCSKKNFNRGKIVFGFAAGSKELHEFVNRNALCEAKPFDYTNNIHNIAANDNMVSINSAIAADLTGQICSESIGPKQFSSTGGQLDFVRGATMSKGGRAFIAIRSTANTKNGIISKITTSLSKGSVVTTPRSDVQYVVTEYGIVNLYNKSISERVKLMISIAHPDFRDELTKEAIETGLI